MNLKQAIRTCVNYFVGLEEKDNPNWLQEPNVIYRRLLPRLYDIHNCLCVDREPSIDSNLFNIITLDAVYNEYYANFKDDSKHLHSVKESVVHTILNSVRSAEDCDVVVVSPLDGIEETISVLLQYRLKTNTPLNMANVLNEYNDSKQYASSFGNTHPLNTDYISYLYTSMQLIGMDVELLYTNLAQALPTIITEDR